MLVLKCPHRQSLPFPSLGDLPNLGVEPRSPALQADSLALSHLGRPYIEAPVSNPEYTKRKKIYVLWALKEMQ